ncbi:MAG: class I SAM-dependent methyltransferase [Desertimonas sp.]
MNVIGAAKRTYASAARVTGRGLQRLHLQGETPPPRSKRWRHWAYSLTRAHDSLAIAELDVPWWTYAAIDEVEGWLGTRDTPVRVFEWGSGASTIWLARRAGEVHSVEHHRGFGEHLAEALSDYPNVEFDIVEPVPATDPVVPSAKEGQQGLDFSDYVAGIDKTEGVFDLIVIDGRAREACLARAVDRVAADGIIVFDNTRRARYRQAIAAAPVTVERHRGLTPTLPYPDETSILRRTRRDG